MIDLLFDSLTAFGNSPFLAPYMAFVAIGGLVILALYFFGGGKDD